MHHSEKVHVLQKKTLCAATKTQSSQKNKNKKRQVLAEQEKKRQVVGECRRYI